LILVAVVVRPPLRNHGYADTREQAQAAFRATWEAFCDQYARAREGASRG